MTVVRNLLIRGGADFSSLRSEMRRAQKNVQDFKNSIKGTVGKLGAVLGTVGFGALAADASRTAMDVEAAMQQINRLMGSSADEFQNWAETSAQAFNMSKANAYKYGSIFGNLVATFSAGTEDTKNKTVDLLKASAVVASGTGRTMDDVMWRIRSGLLGNTEAIEDLGINVYVNMLKSTQAFKQFAGDKSWDQLDFKTQQLIRYYGIMEQANKKFGAEVNQNTNSTLQQFQAALGNVKLALGQAFLPILNKVLPYLTAMANALAKVMGWIAQFMMALFGYKTPAIKVSQASNTAATSIDNVGTSADKAAKKTKTAAKKIKKAAEDIKHSFGLAGFDQLNLLNMPDPKKKEDNSGSSGNSGGSGGGVSGGASPVVTPKIDMGQGEGAVTKISKKIKELADRFKKWIQPAVDLFKSAWGAVSTYFKEKGAQIAKFWKQHGGLFMQAIKNIWNFLKPILKFLIKFLWDSFKGAIDGIIEVFEGIIQFIGGVFTGHWKEAWGGIKKIFFGLIKAIWNITNLMLFKSLITGGIKFVAKFAKGFKDIIPKLKAPFEGIEKWFAERGDAMWSGIKGAFEGVETWFKDNVWSKLVSVVDNFKSDVGAAAGKLWDAIKSAFSSVATWFKDNVWGKVAEAIGNAKEEVAAAAGKVWGAIKGAFTKVYDWFRDSVVKPLYNAWVNWKTTIANYAGSVWGAIKGKFVKIYDWFRDNVVTKLYDAWVNWKGNIATAASNVWGAIKGKFTGAYTWFKNNVADKIASALSTIKSKFTSGVGSGLKGVLNQFISMFNDAIKNFNKFKNKIPFVKDHVGNIPTIPYLAQGGYVGANNPMLAVIGDNTREGEIVAPESKLYEQTLKAIRDAGGGGGPQQLVINIGGTTVYRKLIDGINQTQRQAGKTLIKV